MIHKRILVPGRVRRPPTDGWSWIDRRFVRDFAPRLSHEAIALYFFLAAVADKDGLSFYHDATVPAPPSGILKPYHPQIDGLITKYPDLSAVRVLEEISRGPEGFCGSVYPVRR